MMYHQCLEMIHETNAISKTYRMRVPGGWIYRFQYDDTRGICFVPFFTEEMEKQRDWALTKTQNLLEDFNAGK